MSSVSFELPSWPDIIDDNVLYQQVIIWLFCGLFMLIIPTTMIYYFYALHKLRFVMALRRRHYKLLTCLFVIVLIDFIVIEPIRLLGGAYLSNIDFLYWIYFVLSVTSTQLILYCILLKVWLLFFNIRWIKVCCIDDTQWRYHLYTPYIQKTNHNTMASLSSAGSPLPPDNHQNAQTKRDQEAEHDDEQKDVEEEALHPNIVRVNSKLNTSAAQDTDLADIVNISWFVRHRQTLGNIRHIYKYAIIAAVIAIVLSMLFKCLLDEGLSTALINIITTVPILTIYILWCNTPPFDDLFLMRQEMKHLIIYSVIFVVINTVIDFMLFLQTDATYSIQLQLSLVFVYHILIFGIFMFLVWYPIKSMVLLYKEQMNHSDQPESPQPTDTRTTTAINNESTANGKQSSFIRCCCCISQKLINHIALYQATTVGIHHDMSTRKKMSLRPVASSSMNPNQSSLNQQIAMTEVSNQGKKVKTLSGKSDEYKFNDIENLDDSQDTDNGLEAHDMLVTGHEDDDYEDFNYEDGPEEIIEEEELRGTRSDLHIDASMKRTTGHQRTETPTMTMTMTMTATPIPDAIIRIKPANQTNFEHLTQSQQELLNDNASTTAIRKLFATDYGLKLFLRHCATEFSLENVLALIEIYQYQKYCKEQEVFIVEQMALRRKTAKQRYAKKKQSIERKKKHIQKEIKQKKEKLMKHRGGGAPSVEHVQERDAHRAVFSNLSQKHRRNRSLSHRRKERLKQNSRDFDMLEEHDVMQHEFVSRQPIDIAVSNTLSYMETGDNLNAFSSSMDEREDNEKLSVQSKRKRTKKKDKQDTKDEKKSSSNDDEEEKEEHKDGQDNETKRFVDDGNQGDDEDDEEVNQFSASHAFNLVQHYNLIDVAKLDLPQSSIMSRPFINSKNKRMQQLELIIIDLCTKYIFPSSRFQLNVPVHIMKEIESKIEAMKQSHQLRREKQLNRQREQQQRDEIARKRAQQNTHGDDSSDDDAAPPEYAPQLTNTESNASNWYPEQHEDTLPTFFDDIIEIVLRLLLDSFSRLKLTPQYKQFANENKA